MPRRLIAVLLTVYAIAFAFGALTAVRWPSIVMVMGWIVTDDLANGMSGVNWRELGIAHGAAYLFAALGYYASGATLAARKGGAVGWYLFALAFSIPSVFLVHFDPLWWQDPGAGEGAMAGLMAGALLLLGPKASEALIRWIKGRLGYTPAFGDARARAPRNGGTG